MKKKRYKKVVGIGKTGYVRVGPVKAGPMGVGCLVPTLFIILIPVLLLVAL